MSSKVNKDTSPTRADRARLGLALVDRIARRRWRHYRQQIELEELRSIGREALVWVLDHFDPSLGSFEGYARQRIAGAMADEARKRCRRKLRRRPTLAAGYVADRLARPLRTTRRRERETRQRSVLATSRGEWGTVLHRDDVDELAMCEAPDPESSAMDRSVAEHLRGVVDQLPRRQRTLIERHYYAGEPLSRVAETLGISRHAAHRLHRKTLGIVERRLRALAIP